MSARDEIAGVVREVLDRSGVANKRWRMSISGMIANRLTARPDLLSPCGGTCCCSHVTGDPMADLIERLERANQTLIEMANSDGGRIASKAEGVRLALSYAREAQRADQ